MEYLVVSVPFCDKCAKRLRRWVKLSYCLIGLAILLSVVLGFWLDLNWLQRILLTLILGIPGIWLQLYKDWALRIVDYDKDTLTLEIKRPEYAREVARLNNVSAFSAK
jgi:hypothetical protein